MAEDLHVTIHLRDLNEHDAIPVRDITLRGPSWSMKIGRGTTNGDEELRPMKDNAWFDSKVMSRNHALLKADPKTRTVTLKDVGSMHGTKLAGGRIAIQDEIPLYQHDVVIFGSDVTRGTCKSDYIPLTSYFLPESPIDPKKAYFPALEVSVEIEWSDSKHEESVTPPVQDKFRNLFKNDYDQKIKTSPKSETGIKDIKPRTFSVPDIDTSDDENSDYSESDESKSLPSSVLRHEKCTEEVKVVIPSPPFPCRAEFTSDIDYDSLYDGSDIFDDDAEMEAQIEAMNTFEPPETIAESTCRTGKEARAKIDTPTTPAVSSKSPPFPTKSTRPGITDFESFERNENAWAGHNSVLYEPISTYKWTSYVDNVGSAHQDQPSTSAGASSMPINSPTTISPVQSVPMPELSPDLPQELVSVIKQAKEWNQKRNTELAKTLRQKPSEPFLSLNNVQFAKVDASRKDNHEDEGVSIADIEPQFKFGPGSLAFARKSFLDEVKLGKKRKADDMDETLGRDEIDAHADGMDGKQQVSEVFTVVQTTEMTGPTCSFSEPSKKKRRITRKRNDHDADNQGTSFAKLAITAFAGVAIGAVGTIFGLAALPQDFFV